MHAACPSRYQTSCAVVGVPHTSVLDQALSKSDGAGDGDDEGHQEASAAAAIGFLGRRAVRSQEHADRYEEVCEDLRIGGEHISEEDIAEFAIFGLSDAANRDTAQGFEEVVSPCCRVVS